MTAADPTDEAQRLGQPLTYAWQLTAKPEYLAHFRRLARAAMREWRQPSGAEDAVLHGVTELLANVARHVHNPRCRLEIAKAGTSLYVTVYDLSPTLPTVRPADCAAESGRGLWLLRKLADDFGCARTDDGKRVWIRVDSGAEGEKGPGAGWP